MTFKPGHTTVPPPRFKAGDRYWRLTILEQVPGPAGMRSYRVRCDCGTIKTVRGNAMHRNGTKSCGCIRLNNLRPRAKPTPAEIALIKIMRADAQHEPWALT
jgi:hypothetical protein